MLSGGGKQPDRVMWNGIVDSLVDMEGKGQRQRGYIGFRAIVDEETGLVMGVITGGAGPGKFQFHAA